VAVPSEALAQDGGAGAKKFTLNSCRSSEMESDYRSGV